MDQKPVSGTPSPGTENHPYLRPWMKIHKSDGWRHLYQDTPEKSKFWNFDSRKGLHDQYDHAELKSDHKNDVACQKDVPPRP